MELKRTHYFTHPQSDLRMSSWSSRYSSAVTNPTSIHEDVGLIPMRMQVGSLALLSGLRIYIAVSCSVGSRCSLDLALLWLWCRLAGAAPIRSLAPEIPYATGEALKRKKYGQ